MDIILNNSALITVFASEQNKMIQKLIILSSKTRYIFCKKISKDEKYDLSAVDSALLLINEI